MERGPDDAIHGESRGVAAKARRIRILVVDDAPEIVRILRRDLIHEGHTVDTAGDGPEALAKARDTEPDLVILDAQVRGIDTAEVSKRLRQVGDVSILMLSARGAVPDKVAGLDSGADDYIVKPFDFEELLARVRALLRRRRPRQRDILRFGDLSLNSSAREVTRGNEVVDLTALEFDLLEFFMRHPRQVLNRGMVYESVWGHNSGGESRLLEVYVSYLRAELETGDRTRLIHTVRGVGYVLKE